MKLDKNELIHKSLNHKKIRSIVKGFSLKNYLVISFVISYCSLCIHFTLSVLHIAYVQQLTFLQELIYTHQHNEIFVKPR